MKKIKDTLVNFEHKGNINKDLKDAYLEAIKDTEFKSFVSKLNLNEDIIMKYTSQLQTSFMEYKNCLECKSIHECKNEVKGYAYLPRVRDNKIEFSYVPCQFQKALLKETRHYKNMYYLDVPEEIKSASMSKVFTNDKNRFSTIEWLSKFIKNYPSEKGLYLSGSFGSGKTYLIAAAFNELAKKNIKSAIIYWPEFLRNIKGSFNIDFNEKMEYIKRVELLLIDDIGAENTTSWGRDEILGPILQHRMQAKLPTFFTSNLNMKELEQHFSVTKDSVDVLKAKRIIERIEQLTVKIELLSKNLRK
jgi:primosomal protein DnaI